MYPSRYPMTMLDESRKYNTEKPTVKIVMLDQDAAWSEYADFAGAQDLAQDWEESFGDPSYYGYSD